MRWEDICKLHPNTWLLFEAENAYSANNERILEDILVVSSFDDSAHAMKKYVALHKENSERELYVAHTSRKRLDISERSWLGLRASS